MDLLGLDLFSFLVLFGVGALIFGVIFYFQGIQIIEWRRAKRRHFTLKMENIRATQLKDKFKPSDGSEPVEIELEVLHLKRATGSLSITNDSKESKFDWNLEFRGSTLILTRKEGDLKANWVVEALESDYRRRYGVEDMLYPTATLDNGKVSHATVEDAEKLFEYVHLLKTLSTVKIKRVMSRRGKNLRRTMTTDVN